MPRISTLLTTTALAASLVLPSAAGAAVQVVATTPTLAALAAAVGGKDVSVFALARASQDPHRVDPRPDLMVRLSRARLLLVNGMGLEDSWLHPLQVGARNRAIQVGNDGFLDCSLTVQRLGVPHSADRVHGDVHHLGNPHYTFSAPHLIPVARAVAERLARLDPARAAAYAERGKAVAAQLVEVGNRWRGRFARLPAKRRQVVSYHASLVYLWTWLGVKEVATVEPKPGVPPDPQQAQRVLSVLRSTGARALVQETFYPRRTSQTLAELVGAKVVFLPGGADHHKGEPLIRHFEDIASRTYAAVK